MNLQAKIGTYLIFPSLVAGLFVHQLVDDPNYPLAVKSQNYTDLISNLGVLFLESTLAFLLFFSLCQGVVWVWKKQGGKRFAGVGLALFGFILLIATALIIWNASICYTCP